MRNYKPLAWPGLYHKLQTSGQGCITNYKPPAKFVSQIANLWPGLYHKECMCSNGGTVLQTSIKCNRVYVLQGDIWRMQGSWLRSQRSVILSNDWSVILGMSA